MAKKKAVATGDMAAKREAVRAILKDRPDASSTDIADELKGRFDIPEKKAWSVYVSQQRKALGIGSTTEGKSDGGKDKGKGKRVNIGLEELSYVRQIVRVIGGKELSNVEKAYAVAEWMNRHGDGAKIALKAIEKWKGIVEKVGEDSAVKFIDAMNG